MEGGQPGEGKSVLDEIESGREAMAKAEEDALAKVLAEIGDSPLSAKVSKQEGYKAKWLEVRNHLASKAGGQISQASASESLADLKAGCGKMMDERRKGAPAPAGNPAQDAGKPEAKASVANALEGKVEKPISKTPQAPEPKIENRPEVAKTGDKMTENQQTQPSEPQSAPSRPAGPLKLKHFIWYPIHGKGYQDQPIASTDDFNPLVFVNMFMKEFIPIIVSYGQKDYRAFMLYNKPSVTQVLLTHVYHRENVDEYGRTGVFHHSAIIDKKLIQSGYVSLVQVQKAMEAFDDSNPFPKGGIPPLEIEPNATPALDFEGTLKDYVTIAAAETLATRIMQSDHNRTTFRCEGAKARDRFKIGLYVAELMSFTCGLRPISFTTERPAQAEYFDLFDLTVTERAIKPDVGAAHWGVIEWDMVTPALPRIKGKEEVYKKIEKAYE